jgi:hypothetical protein
MGQPRVVMGIDAAEAIRFADFLDRRAGLCKPRPEPALPSDQLDASPQTAVTGAPCHRSRIPGPVYGGPDHSNSRIRANASSGTWSRHASDPVGDEIARWDISNL